MRRVLGFAGGLIVAIVVLFAVVAVLRWLSRTRDIDYARLSDGFAPWVLPLLLIGGATGAWKAPLPAAVWTTALGVIVGIVTFPPVGRTLMEFTPPRWFAVCFVFGWIPLCGLAGCWMGTWFDRKPAPSTTPERGET